MALSMTIIHSTSTELILHYIICYRIFYMNFINFRKKSETKTICQNHSKIYNWQAEKYLLGCNILLSGSLSNNRSLSVLILAPQLSHVQIGKLESVFHWR